MSAVKPWVKDLDIKFQDYESWTLEVPSEQSITYWALDRGKLRMQDYLYWAREHYQLPVLKDSFFKNEASTELYQQMQTVANWSPQMLPIDQWDGVVYIACVEPPEEVNWSFPVRYVLASARVLKQFWATLHNGDQHVAAPPAPPSAPEPISVAARTAPTQENGAPVFMDDFASSEPGPPEMPEGFELSTTESSASLGEAPEGLSDSVSHEFSTDAVPEGLSQTVETRTQLASEAPEGFSETAETPTLISAEAPEGFHDSDSQELATDAAPEGFSQVQETEQEVTTPEPPSGELESEPKSEPEEDEEFEDLSGPMAGTTTQFGMTITGANSSAQAGSVIDLDKDLPKTLDEATGEKEIVAWSFNELKQSFSQSMILLVEGKNLRPWKWESIWNPASTHSFEPFAADKPGVFRIVLRTKQAYHGYLVESPANKKFFEDWGFPQLPGHVTLLPITYDGVLVGVCLSIGEEASNTESNLIAAERVIDKMAAHLKDHLAKAA